MSHEPWKLSPESRVRSARNGNFTSGPVPYGYRRGARVHRGPGGRPLEAEPREAGAVELVFRLYLEKRAMSEIRRALEDEGYPPRRAATWSLPAIRFLLKNPIYIGRIYYAGVWALGNHPALVARETWNAAQALMRAKDKRHRGRVAAAEREAS